MPEQMSRDILVIAGNYQQFKNLCAQAQQVWDFELKHKMVHYMMHPDDLKGRLPCRVFLYGNFGKRKDWEAMREACIRYKHRPLLIRGGL